MAGANLKQKSKQLFRDDRDVEAGSRPRTRSLASAVSLHEYTDDDDNNTHANEVSLETPPTYQDIGPTVQDVRVRYVRGDQDPSLMINGLFPRPAIPFSGSTKQWQSLFAPYSRDPAILHRMLVGEARVPAQPVVHVVGTHREITRDKDGQKQEKRITDFDIKVDVSEIYAKRTPAFLEQQYREKFMGVSPDQYYREEDYPIPERAVTYWHKLDTVYLDHPTFRGGIFRAVDIPSNGANKVYRDPNGSNVPGRASYDDDDAETNRDNAIDSNTNDEDEEAALTDSQEEVKDPEYWCERFCLAAAGRRPCEFRFRRKVSAWDTKLVSKRLDALIRATNYRGDIAVTFPLQNEGFTILSPHKINILKSKPYVFWACILLQLWIITWPILFLIMRKYDVVYVDWPYSKTGFVQKTPDELQQERRNGVNKPKRHKFVKEYASVSEEQWLDSWGRTVAEKAVARHSGFIFWADVAASVRAREEMGGQYTGARGHGYHEDQSRDEFNNASQPRVDLGNGYANAAYGAVNALVNGRRRSDGDGEQGQGVSGRAWGASDSATTTSGSIKIGGASVRL